MERIKVKEFITSREMECFLNRISLENIIKIFASSDYYGVIYKENY